MAPNLKIFQRFYLHADACGGIFRALNIGAELLHNCDIVIAEIIRLKSCIGIKQHDAILNA